MARGTSAEAELTTAGEPYDSPSGLFGEADAGVDESDEFERDTSADDESDSEDYEGEGGRQEAAKPTTEEKKFKLWDGTEITPSQLASDPHLLERVIQTANQAPHLQRKYVEMLEEYRKLQQPQHKDQQVTQQRPMTKEELVKMYEEDTDKKAMDLIKEGVISEETYAVAPDLVRMTVRVVDHLMRLQQENAELKHVLNEQILPVFEIAAQLGDKITTTEFTTALSSRLAELVKQRPQLSVLLRDDLRNAIAESMVKQYGPQILNADDRVLIQGVLSQNIDSLLEILQKASIQSANRKQEQTRLTRGESTSPRGARVRNQDILELFRGG